MILSINKSKSKNFSILYNSNIIYLDTKFIYTFESFFKKFCFQRKILMKSLQFTVLYVI